MKNFIPNFLCCDETISPGYIINISTFFIITRDTVFDLRNNERTRHLSDYQ